MLSIIIVNWNVSELLYKTLKAIVKNPPTTENYEVIVIDNKSSDNSCEMVKKYFPKTILIENKENKGFGSANNQGLSIAKGSVILFLNPDTEVQAGALDLYIEKLNSSKEIGAMGVKLLNNDKSIQPSCKRFPDLDTVVYNSFFFDVLFPKSKVFGGYEMSWFDYNQEIEVDQPMGAALGVRKDVLDKVGWFDENFFMYFEEVDLCFRVKKAGFKIVYYPQAEIIHHGGRSTSQAQMNMNSAWYKSFFQYLRKNKQYPSSVIIFFLSLLVVGKIITILALISIIVITVNHLRGI